MMCLRFCIILLFCFAETMIPFVYANYYLPPSELCDNGIDDDFDGLIDLNDPDCTCEIIEPISLIPNPSFEDMDCCPSGRSQLDCASVWIQASEPTTDYIHSCGWFGWNDFPPPLPFPDGQGIMGFRDGRVRNNNDPDRNWKEYAGACLLSPLEKDRLYRFEFQVGFVSPEKSPPVNITFFGTSDCINLPFGVGNEDFGCPTNGPGWVKLESTLVSGGQGNRWVEASIEVVPDNDITAIAIGPDCPAVDSPISIYYFFDNLLLADFRSFDLRITEIHHPCASDFSLKVPDNSEFKYQWYRNGIALEGEVFSQLMGNYGEANYQVRIDDGTSCRVSTNFNYRIPVRKNRKQITICKDGVYTFGGLDLTEPGIYIDTIPSIHNCDSIITLELNVLGELADTISAKIFEGESYQIEQYRFQEEGNHLLTLSSSMGCDSLVLLKLEYYQVYFPNVFSPNNDRFNDTFSVLSANGLVLESTIRIYDRWGMLVFSGEEWDGKYKDKYVDPGAYIFVSNLKMSDGQERQFFGSVTVLR